MRKRLGKILWEHDMRITPTMFKIFAVMDHGITGRVHRDNRDIRSIKLRLAQIGIRLEDFLKGCT